MNKTKGSSDFWFPSSDKEESLSVLLDTDTLWFWDEEVTVRKMPNTTLPNTQTHASSTTKSMSTDKPASKVPDTQDLNRFFQKELPKEPKNIKSNLWWTKTKLIVSWLLFFLLSWAWAWYLLLSKKNKNEQNDISPAQTQTIPNETSERKWKWFLNYRILLSWEELDKTSFKTLSLLHSNFEEIGKQFITLISWISQYPICLVDIDPKSNQYLVDPDYNTLITSLRYLLNERNLKIKSRIYLYMEYVYMKKYSFDPWQLEVLIENSNKIKNDLVNISKIVNDYYNSKMWFPKQVEAEIIEFKKYYDQLWIGTNLGHEIYHSYTWIMDELNHKKHVYWYVYTLDNLLKKTNSLKVLLAWKKNTLKAKAQVDTIDAVINKIIQLEINLKTIFNNPQPSFLMVKNSLDNLQFVYDDLLLKIMID